MDAFLSRYHGTFFGEKKVKSKGSEHRLIVLKIICNENLAMQIAWYIMQSMLFHTYFQYTSMTRKVVLARDDHVKNKKKWREKIPS